MTAKITREAIEALKPFADAVYNDNGDMTINLSFAKSEDFIKAYFVYRRLSALPIAGEGTPEEEAEHFIQTAIDRAPEPMRRLGEYLANVLPEDEFATADRMLLGAMEAANATGFKVKPLEWKEIATPPAGEEYAASPIGTYYIELGRKRFPLKLRNELFGTFGTLDAAKAAAQTDYETRILSALISSPGKDAGQEVEAVSEAALLARVASIICEETCGLTSQCKSREAAKALFDKGYLRSLEVNTSLQAGYVEATERAEEAVKAANALQAEVDHLRATRLQPSSTSLVERQSMDTAPLDGKHCLLAVKEGAFIYTVQGAYQKGEWNAVHRNNVKPLCWMPNVRVPAEFLPYRDTIDLESADANS